MMDCNEDIMSNTMQSFLEDCGLQNVMAGHHERPIPATRKGGKSPIDGIFASWAIRPVASGICCAEEGIEGPRADHRRLWVDVNLENVLGQKIPVLPRRIINRCNAKDPRVYNKYNQLLIQHLEEHNLEDRMFQLERQAIYPMPVELQQRAEQLDKLYMEGHRFTDKRCRKLRTGGTAYTPEFTSIMAELLLFKMLLRRKRDPEHKISDRVLCKYLKRAGKTSPLQEYKALTEAEVQIRLKEVQYKLKEYRRSAEKKRSNWLEELVEARATEEAQQKADTDDKPSHRKRNGGLATARELKILRTTVATRRQFRKN